jgi:hypothetical protein
MLNRNVIRAQQKKADHLKGRLAAAEALLKTEHSPENTQAYEKLRDNLKLELAMAEAFAKPVEICRPTGGSGWPAK